MQPIKLSFWGTPPISALLLRKLASDSRFSVTFVVTQADKPRSARGREVLPSAVKQAALDLHIPVFTPHSLKKEKTEIEKILNEYKPDLHIVIAYGKILPNYLLHHSEARFVNFHASLLPHLRGAAPIESALLLGDTMTGWTLQSVNDRLDAGDIFSVTNVPIHWEDDRDTLYQKLTTALLDFAPDAIVAMAHDRLFSETQNEENATYCGKILTAQGEIDFQKPWVLVRNQARAYAGKPGVFSNFRGKKVKLQFDLGVTFDKLGEKAKAEPGSITEITPEVIYIACTDGRIAVKSFHFEGKKVLSVQDFINGYNPKIHEKFGSVN